MARGWSRFRSWSVRWPRAKDAAERRARSNPVRVRTRARPLPPSLRRRRRKASEEAISGPGPQHSARLSQLPTGGHSGRRPGRGLRQGGSAGFEHGGPKPDAAMVDGPKRSCDLPLGDPHAGREERREESRDFDILTVMGLDDSTVGLRMVAFFPWLRLSATVALTVITTSGSSWPTRSRLRRHPGGRLPSRLPRAR